MIIEHFYENVLKFPHKAALIVGQEKLTYLELSQRVAALSCALKEKNVREGSHIALILKNSTEFVVLMLASAHLGATIVPLNTTLKLEMVIKAIRASDATFVVADNSLLRGIQEASSLSRENCLSINDKSEVATTYRECLEAHGSFPLTPIPLKNDDCFIVTLTSGSTGAPKPIIFSQTTKINRAFSARDCYQLDHSIVSLAATPLYHSLAQRLVLLPLLLGGTAVVMTHFTPKLWLEAVSQQKVTFAIPVSSQLANILLEFSSGNYETGSLKTLVSSSAPITRELKESLMETLNCEIHEIYGTSEIGVATNLAPADGKSKLGTVGKALPGVDVKIMEDGEFLPLGTVGEIVVRTPTAFVGYLKLPEETQKAMKGGYFHTGDLGRLDREGFLTFVGRKKDIIITGGINVYPQDIEDVLMKSPLLKECSVIGVNDVLFGEAILAVIVPHFQENFNLRELKRLCLSHLADYQQPLAYEIVEKLPRNSMNKILKQELRHQFKDLDVTQNLRKVLRTPNLGEKAERP